MGIGINISEILIVGLKNIAANITAGLLNHGQPGVNSSGIRFAGEATGDGWNNRDYTAPDMIRHDNNLLPVYL